MSEELPTGPKESPPAPRAGPREVWKKGGRLLSVLLSVNVLLLACTLISGGAFNKVAVYDTDVFALLTAMMLLAGLWILFYLLRTVRSPDSVPYRDSHAGPIWLRGAWGGGDGSGVGQAQSWRQRLSEELLGALGRPMRSALPGGPDVSEDEVGCAEGEKKGKESGRGLRDGEEFLCPI